MKIKIADLVLDAGTQIRTQLDPDTVNEYADQYRAKAKMPPVTAFSKNGSPKILADGFHRVAGAEKAGLTQIEVDLKSGDATAAIKFALGANAAHGLKRTTEDKVNAVKIASEKFPDLNNQDICKLCQVSDDFVRKHRVGQSPVNAKKESKKSGGPPPKAAGNGAPAGPPPKAADPSPAHSSKRSGPPPATLKRQAPTDGTGMEIPAEILQAWEDAGEIQAQLNQISTMRGILKNAEESKGPRWAEVNFSTAMAGLSQAYNELKLVKPFAVCPTCSGLATADCAGCKGRGFVSEFYWQNCVPEEARKLREKAAS